MAFNFPILKTRTGGPSFKLEDPAERAKYYRLKAGEEIDRIREYLEKKKGTFMGVMLGPKNSGKGTYVKGLMEAVGSNDIAHISIGDIVRKVTAECKDETKKGALIRFLEERYRGFTPLEKVLDAITGRDTTTLLPDEVILALAEREVEQLGKRPVFIDGFPRNLDQVRTSLYFRTLMGYSRQDPDFLVFIDVPETIIDERFKQRVICPVCQTPRGLKLLRTKEVGYDADKKEFYLKCDDSGCSVPGTRMVTKEGDEKGIEAIRGRLEVDKQVMSQLINLQGIPKVLLRNSIPVASASELVDDYEITPASRYETDGENVKIIEEPWTVTDEDGISSYSMLPPWIVVSFVKQVAKILENA